MAAMKPVQLSAKSNEHYTPKEITLAARAVMGGIDLDPASCALANENVGAVKYYTKEDDGLIRPWHGRIWVNPPGGKPTDKVTGKRINRSLSQMFYFKAVEEWQARNAEQVMFLGFTLEILRLSQHSELPSALRFPFCILRERTDFLQPVEGKLVAQEDPTHANVVIYMPPDHYRRGPEDKMRDFENIFSCFGDVIIPRTIATRP